MLKNLRQHGRLAGNDAAIAAGKQAPPEYELVDVNPAVSCSRVINLLGRPYAVQFHSQGAIDAWTRALGTLQIWRRWQEPSTRCWQIRKTFFGSSNTRVPSARYRGQWPR